MYASTNGAVLRLDERSTWPSLQGPGRSACSANGYFACMFGTNDWRHMGWGEPAANGNNVFLDWAACGSGGNTCLLQRR